MDKGSHRERDLAERFWRRVKDFRRVAVRHAKDDRNSLASAHLTSFLILLP